MQKASLLIELSRCKRCFILVFIVAAAFVFSHSAHADDLVVVGPGPDSPIPPRLIYAVTKTGQMLVSVDASTDGTSNWVARNVPAPAIPNVNWADFAQIAPGGDGAIYAVNSSGALLYFRLLDPWRNGGKMRWSSDSNTNITPQNFGTPTYAALYGLSRQSSSPAVVVRDGIIWATVGSNTYFLQHGWQANGLVATNWSMQSYGLDDSYVGHVHPPDIPPQCPTCTTYFEGGDGITYGITSDGLLLRFRLRSTGDWVNGGTGQILGGGWSNYATVFAEPGAYFIEGYVSTTRTLASGNVISSMSVAPGETVRVRASTFSPSYGVRLLRLQRHTQNDATNPTGLIDGIAIGSNVQVGAPAGGNFKKAADPTRMNSTGAGWASDGADLKLPNGATPGLYAAYLTTPSGGQYFAPFVVKPRPSDPARKIAVLANVTNWNAYNPWGGGSRYFSYNIPPTIQDLGPPTTPAPYNLSYERPLWEYDPAGTGEGPGLLNRIPTAPTSTVRSEVWVATWLDSLAQVNPAYDYDFFSDVDLDQGIPSLSQYRVLILDTHPEYWSDQMRTNLEAYLNGGGHLIYFAGNGLYDRITFTSSGQIQMRNGVGGPRCFGQPSVDPCPARDLFRFSNAAYPDGRSERLVLGVSYETFVSFIDLSNKELGYTVTDYFGTNTPHPFLTQGTTLQVGSSFGDIAGLNFGLGIVGWETNQYNYDCEDFPNGICSTSHQALLGTVIATNSTNQSDLVYHRTPAGGWVLAGGSIPSGGVLAIDPTTQQIMRNAIDNAISGSPAP